jgi:hypothetical protein
MIHMGVKELVSATIFGEQQNQSIKIEISMKRFFGYILFLGFTFLSQDKTVLV